MHSFRGIIYFPSLAQSFLRQPVRDQQQEEEGLSVMTNVYVSSPRTAAPFFPHGAQKVAVHCVSTQLCQAESRLSSCTDHILLHFVLLWEGLEPKKYLCFSLQNIQILGADLLFLNMGQVWDFGSE